MKQRPTENIDKIAKEVFDFYEVEESKNGKSYVTIGKKKKKLTTNLFNKIWAEFFGKETIDRFSRLKNRGNYDKN